MELVLLAKDDKSGDKGCPSVYLSDTGEFVVQGVGLNDTDFSELADPLPGETAVRISPEIVLAAVEAYRRRSV
ncbi:MULTISPECIES: hypothetical protein [Nocardiopsis]|uniref:DUF397 domain-containing protein n=1 Tax=Nocardiopsis lambiniae TaxID=3075539 RepID=A0ABU2MBR3_9ACTN|nr:MULTISPECIES: hypothetical protein [unclassified Nocardiopsis]MDE3723563.1 hypothetical protein [Nocardiopsis sp. N85]MDT0330039.1 hypothetical protein [Nocardiopsis sp. DSM 44743]